MTAGRDRLGPCVRPLLLAVLVLGVALAGCGEPGQAAEPDVIVLSGSIVDANATQAAPTGKGVGHIAGFVVDDAIRPVKDATVSLPALDLQDKTDRDGRFEFVDLAPGDYVIRINATGHQEAESMLTVEKGRFTRAKVILHRIPPPEPYREVFDFQGFAEVTQFGGVLSVSELGCECSWTFEHDPTDATALVFEATHDGYTGPVPGHTEIWMLAYDGGCCDGRLMSDWQEMPFWQAVPVEHALSGSIDLDATLNSFPAPELSKSYEVFVTVFHNEPVPDGYSIVAGDT